MSRAKHYHRDLARKRNGTEKGEYVIEHDGKFRRSGVAKKYQFGTFKQAHVYSSKAHALNATERAELGVVMKKMSTESMTTANYTEEVYAEGLGLSERLERIKQ